LSPPPKLNIKIKKVKDKSRVTVEKRVRGRREPENNENKKKKIDRRPGCLEFAFEFTELKLLSAQFFPSLFRRAAHKKTTLVHTHDHGPRTPAVSVSLRDGGEDYFQNFIQI